ncbi:hypothetical protein [Nocardia sp. IFM 10818]
MNRIPLMLPLTAIVVSMAACTSNSTDVPNLAGAALTGPPGVLKSPEQQATEQATAAITRFYEVLTRVVTGGADEELEAVATAPYLDQLRRELADLRAPEVRVTGSLRAAAASSVKIIAPQDEEKAPIPGQASAELRVCEDRSRLQVSGRDPASLPSQTRLRRFVLINPGWPQGNWVIAQQFAMPNTDCTKQY